MACYSDVIVMRHPEKGAVQVSVIIIINYPRYPKIFLAITAKYIGRLNFSKDSIMLALETA